MSQMPTDIPRNNVPAAIAAVRENAPVRPEFMRMLLGLQDDASELLAALKDLRAKLGRPLVQERRPGPARDPVVA